MKTLLLGSSGTYVRAWQRIFRTHADGKFGPGTDVACRAWQRSRGIDPDGVVGPLTRAAVQPGDMVKAYEGCVLVAYDDAQDVPLGQRLIHMVGGSWRRADGSLCRGVPTIGWGSTEPCRRGVQSCTQAEADQWLLEFMSLRSIRAAKRYAGDRDAAAQEAVNCFCYNLGAATHLLDGTDGPILKLANAGFTFAAWPSFDHVRGHEDLDIRMRREEEAAMYWGEDVPASDDPAAA